MTEEHILALFLILVIWSCVVVASVIATKRNGRAPADDIGLLWLVVMALYTTLPPIAWLFSGGAYHVNDISRLFILQPPAADVVALLEIATGYVASFTVVYVALLSRSSGPHRLTVARIDAGKLVAALTLMLTFKLAMFILNITGVVSPKSYIESYSSILQLPTVARQMIKIGSGVASIAQTVVLVALIQRWPKYRGLMVLYVVAIVVSFDPEGARTGIVTALLAIAIAWHILVRPVPIRWWVTGGCVGLLAFLAFGARRSMGSWSEVGVHSYNSGEFDQLWANAAELLVAKSRGWADVSPDIRFGEFWAFIPSQLLPIPKTSLSQWFLNEFYRDYAQQGGGWAFGAMAQAVIGGGVIEAIVRGLALGLASSALVRAHRRGSERWWSLPLYLYLMMFVYLSVRDTTFRPLTDVLQIAVPGLLLVSLLGRLFLPQGPREARPIPR